jgi:hypothetical protein
MLLQVLPPTNHISKTAALKVPHAQALAFGINRTLYTAQ